MEVVATILSLLLIAVAFFRHHRRANSDANLPPGSLGWPILGETMEFLFGKPGKFMDDRMKKYSPDIFKTKILGEKTVVICGPNGHKFLFSNENNCFTAYRPHSMQHLFRSYLSKAAAAAMVDQTKTTLRQPGLLKPESLMLSLAKMDSVIQQQLNAHCEGENIVLFSPLAKTLTLAIACQFFLGDIDNPKRFLQLVKCFNDVIVGTHSITLNLPGTIFYRANKAAAIIRKELRSIIKEKKQVMANGAQMTPMHDLLSRMILGTDPNGKSVPDAEIADKIMGLLIGAYSSATIITFFVKYVGLNREIYERVREEQMKIAASKKPGELLEWEDIGKMKYSWNVIMEIVRLFPPNQGTFRQVLKDFNYAGYTVPKGWKVHWNVSTTNANSEYFREPEKFNPSRYDEGEARPPPYAFVPFGGGPRLCPGKEYVRLATLVFVHNIVRKYKWQVIDPNEKLEGYMIREPQKGLPVRFYRL